jgi:hypothetical protein
MKATLHNPQQAKPIIDKIWLDAKAWLMAGRRLTIELKEATRSSDANARLHATITDVARQIDWAGQRREVEVWKRLLTAAWLRARGEHVEVLPALDNRGVDVVFRRTSSLTGAECAELCEFIYAWGTEHGVKFTAPESMDAHA